MLAHFPILLFPISRFIPLHSVDPEVQKERNSERSERIIKRKKKQHSRPPSQTLVVDTDSANFSNSPDSIGDASRAHLTLARCLTREQSGDDRLAD